MSNVDPALTIQLGETIGSQIDLLWSAAMAAMVAEIYILCRFLESNESSVGCLSRLTLALSILAHFASLVFGYLARGAVTAMGIRLVHKPFIGQVSFSDVESDTLWQVLCFALGLLLAVSLFVVNHKAISRTMRRS